MSSKKPFACRIGMHSWYTDSALIHSAKKCNHCAAVENAREAEELANERRRLSRLPAGSDLGEMYAAAAGIHNLRKQTAGTSLAGGKEIAEAVLDAFEETSTRGLYLRAVGEAPTPPGCEHARTQPVVMSFSSTATHAPDVWTYCRDCGLTFKPQT